MTQPGDPSTGATQPDNTAARPRSHPLRDATTRVVVGCLVFLLTVIALVFSGLTAGLAAMVLTVISMVMMARFMIRARREGVSWLTRPMPISIQVLSVASTMSWMVYALWINSQVLMWINVVAFVVSCVSLRVSLVGRRQAAKQSAPREDSPEVD